MKFTALKLLLILSLCFAVPEFLASCHSSHEESAVPSKALAYPDTYGVYAADGAEFTPLYDSGRLGTTPEEINRHLTFPKKLSILVFQKWIASATADIDSIEIRDWRSLSEEPTAQIDAAIKPVENRQDMIMIVPKQPLRPGLYSLNIGNSGPEYQFGVETPNVEDFWKSVLDERPTSWQAHNHLGALLYMRGDTNGAYSHFVKAVQLNPDNPEGHNNLGLTLASQGKTDEAIQQYEMAVKIKEDPAMETNLGNAYEQVKRYDDAIISYQHAIALNPWNASAHCNLGYALMQQGKVNDAISEFQKTVEIDPNMPQGKADLQEALRLKEKGQ